MTVTLRLIAESDASALMRLVVANGELMAPWDAVPGAFQSAHPGYRVDRASNGRGIATAEVAALLPIAFDERALHRPQAATLLHNARSQRVLAHNGFTRIGTAERYIRIAGRWQDHVLFQRLAGESA